MFDVIGSNEVFISPVTAIDLFTVNEVAERLNLHAKTVRRYIREGRLKAKRIGKEYRITRMDLNEFAGGTVTAEEPVPRTRQVIVSSIVDVDAISPEESHRITTMIMAGLNARRGEGDFPRVDSIYHPERAGLRITITANPVLTCDLLRMINALLKAGRG
jgi:excisionase family DNA binding protein